MREIMRKEKVTEDQAQKISEQKMTERRKAGDQLFEKWQKKPTIGEGLDSLYEADADRARNTAIILENQEQHLKSLTESQLSTTFKTAPNNVIRVVRLAYPNSVRGDIFTEWAMQTARDSVFYLKGTYGKTKRGATAGDTMKSSFSDRYFSEHELEDTDETANGSITEFTGEDSGSLLNAPLVPHTVQVFLNDVPVGSDDGAGNIVGDDIAAGTINYTTGAISVTFDTAPATGDVVNFGYNFQSEDPSQYEDIGNVHLSLEEFLFRAQQYPLGLSWTKMTDLLLGTTLNIDAEEALLSAGADELKKSLDYQALRLGYRYAKGTTPVTFDANWSAAGADSEVAHAQSVTKAFDDAGDVIFNNIGRGGVSYVYGGPKAINFTKLHNRFDSNGRQPAVGAHRIGGLDGVPFYKVPSNIVPNDELVCVWKNDSTANDSAIMFGTLVSLYATPTLTFKEAYSEMGLHHYGDHKVTNKKYITRIKFDGLV